MWWGEVAQQIINADAVILLLSPSALTSESVKREMVLACTEKHRELDELPRLFVLRTTQVRATDIADSDLGKLGLHSVHNDIVSDADTMHAAVSAVLRAIRDVHSNRPTKLLEERLERWLATCGPVTLEQCAQTLGVDPASCRGRELVATLGRRLLEFGGDTVAGVRRVQRFLEHLPPPSDSASVVIDLLVAAAAMPSSVGSDVRELLEFPDRDVVSVAVRKPQTGKMYLRRACTT